MQSERTIAGTVLLMSNLLTNRQRFVHTRYGDGAISFIYGVGRGFVGAETCEGEAYSPELGERLLMAWRTLICTHDLLVGDPMSCEIPDEYVREQWNELVAEGTDFWERPLRFVHFESMIARHIHSAIFYLAVANDSRRKVYIGPERMAGAAKMLHADFISVPLRTAYENFAETAEKVRTRGYDVALFSAGLGGKLMQARLTMSAPYLTQIDVGSGLDLLFHGPTRGLDHRVDRQWVISQYREAGLEL